jgi:NMD protein affecting ribosome stability and mRNA decay
MSMHGEHVCAECFEDEDICAFVREHLEFDECSYCGETSEDGARIAADVEDVIDFIEGKLSEEYEDLSNRSGGTPLKEAGLESTSTDRLTNSLWTGSAGFLVRTTSSSRT